MNTVIALTLLSSSIAMLGCAAGDEAEDVQAAADDSITSSVMELTGGVKFGTRLATTASLNLRTGPSTSYSIRLVMPKGETVRVVSATPSNGWYNVNSDGKVGWASGAYLKDDLTPSTARQEATGRAISVWGFSYQWGGGDWDPTSQSPGQCSGSCPNCTHSGTNGADCSGMVAKAWVVPSTNTPLTKSTHPYSTANFYNDGPYWNRITRANAKEADAMVYHDSSTGSGHIFFVYGGDPWGAITAIECKGCSAGCLYNTRNSVSSAYVAIHRTGY
jgi:uncharacterized protein YraI